MYVENSLPQRWSALSPEERLTFSSELKKEISNQHLTAGLELTAIARLEGRDDFLFQNLTDDNDWFVVHLTWCKETSAEFPWATRFASFSDFRANWKRIWD
ncbi:MAG: hypothetical protein V7695_20185 [Sulfitobacter sp.]|jgi:hypothetical protein